MAEIPPSVDQTQVLPRTKGELRRWLEDQVRDRSILPPQRSPIRVVKAGAITDADFDFPPPPFTMGLDTTNDRLYVKYVDETWHYADLT